jgi:AraC-like DNA-binding protein
MTIASHSGTEGTSADRFAALRQSTTANGWVRPPRASNATVLVAHSSRLIAAGLSAVLRRLQGSQVRVWDPMSEPAAVAAVVIVDDLATAAEFSTRTDPAGQAIGVAPPKIVLLTDGTKEVDAASLGWVSAWLSIDCPEEELLGAVQALLQDARPTRWSAPIGPDFGRCTALNPAVVAPGNRPTGGLAPGALRRVREHIEANFAHKIDLSRLASIAGLSTSYFSRAFKQSIGMPPYRYVMMRRLASAAELIRKTAKSLAEVAIEVGFSDQSHFTRIFNQMTGETPGTLRRRYR